ncbi:MAG: STAS/SEC14 domain-containing protein, partial [Tepidiphilus sp.]|nr:STAS/SEC14 domain-containing protein [Tepidiphilus sp.]
LDLRGMLGFTIDAAWEEFRFARQHPNDFRRIAIVAEDDWLALLTWLESLFLEAEIKVFDSEEEALSWLKEGRNERGNP